MSETTFAATFRATDQSMAAVFSGVQFAGDGGTNVTIGGKILMTLAVDEYVAAALAQLVDSAPATLDTLAKLSKALGDNPNFATTVMELIGKKVEKVTDASVLYGTDANGASKAVPYALHAAESSVPVRTQGGELLVHKAEQDQAAVPRKMMDEALAGKLDRVPNPNGYRTIYGELPKNGGVAAFVATNEPSAATQIPLTEKGGAVKVGDPTHDKHAVNRAYLKDILDERIGDISAALADAHAHAQSLVNGGGA